MNWITEFWGSKKWRAVGAAVATVWGGVLGGQATAREAIATTVAAILTGVLGQGLADFGKHRPGAGPPPV